jgi:hypothetical protein
VTVGCDYLHFAAAGLDPAGWPCDRFHGFIHGGWRHPAGDRWLPAANEIRLAWIDAPETAQAPYLAASREHLQELAPLGSVGTHRHQFIDKYGRTVAEVFRDGQCPGPKERDQTVFLIGWTHLPIR